MGFCSQTGSLFDSGVAEYARYSSVSLKVRYRPLNLNDSWADEGLRPNEKLTVDCSTVDALRLQTTKRERGQEGYDFHKGNRKANGSQATETTPRGGLQMRSEFMTSG